MSSYVYLYKEIAVNYKIWRKQEIWQLCCANMAMLLVITFSKYIQRDVSSSKTWVWRKELSFFQLEPKICRKLAKWRKTEIWQTCSRELATLLVIHFSKTRQSIPCPPKHGYRHQNKVPNLIRTKDIPRTLKYGERFITH